MIEINKESEKKAFVHKILGRKRMILVTGGAGYIGSHTCIELIEQGHEIVVVDNLINSAVEAISRIEEITGKSVAVIEGDVRDESVLGDIFNQFKIESRSTSIPPEFGSAIDTKPLPPAPPGCNENPL